MKPTVKIILAALREKSDEHNRLGMARYGIRTENALGISVPEIRAMAKQNGIDHGMAVELWQTEIHEARLLAIFIADYRQVTPELMEEWASEFDSWDVTDQCCNHLFRKTPYAWETVERWAVREEEFVKRAAFALIASLAMHDRKADARRFRRCLDIIRSAATDDRNFVKKAVNWALRQIGKRHVEVHPFALQLAEELAASGDRTERWIGKDAARELRSEAVLSRLGLRTSDS